MKAEEVIRCSRVGGSLNQFQKSILQETKAKEVQWSSSLSNYTAVHIATNSSKNLGYRGRLGPHRLSCPHSLAHRHTAELSEHPSRSWGWSTNPLPVHSSPTCGVHVCACVQMNLHECVNECGYMCVGICVSMHVSIVITFAVLDPPREVVRRIESLCPQVLPESFL